MLVSGESDKSHSNSAFDMTKVSPGAYAAQPEALPTSSSAYSERMTMDINMLKKQYKKLRGTTATSAHHTDV